MCCSVLQCVAVYCSVLQYEEEDLNWALSKCVAVCCSVLQHVAVYCDVSQGVAVCRSTTKRILIGL